MLEELDRAIIALVGDDEGDSEAFTRRQIAKLDLGSRFAETRADGQCWFEASDVVACLELLEVWKKDLPRFFHERNRQKLIESLAVMKVAVLYAWAVRTRKAAARFAAAEVQKWAVVGGTSLKLGERVSRLVLVARSENLAESSEEGLMGKLVMRVFEEKFQKIQG